MRDLLGFDHTVQQDAAANAVAIALCRDISGGRLRGHRELQRPRQTDSVSMRGVTIDIEIADVGYRPRGSEDLVFQCVWG